MRKLHYHSIKIMNVENCWSHSPKLHSGLSLRSLERQQISNLWWGRGRGQCGGGGQNAVIRLSDNADISPVRLPTRAQEQLGWSGGSTKHFLSLELIPSSSGAQHLRCFFVSAVRKCSGNLLQPQTRRREPRPGALPVDETPAMLCRCSLDWFEFAEQIWVVDKLITMCILHIIYILFVIFIDPNCLIMNIYLYLNINLYSSLKSRAVTQSRVSKHSLSRKLRIKGQ